MYCKLVPVRCRTYMHAVRGGGGGGGGGGADGRRQTTADSRQQTARVCTSVRLTPLGTWGILSCAAPASCLSLLFSGSALLAMTHLVLS